MALEFRRRRFWKPGKKGQLVLACLGLLLAIGIVVAWISVSYRDDRMKNPAPSEDADPDSDTASLSAEQYAPEDAANLLLLLDETPAERICLLQFDPADSAVRLAEIPPCMQISEGKDLLSVWQKGGAVAVVAAVADTLELPLTHYYSIKAEQAEKWFNYLEDGITVTIPEDIRFTDRRGSALRLSKGENNLTATQTINMLIYDQWEDAVAGRAFHAELLGAMFDRYLITDRNLLNDFSHLSNLGKTDLRIGDYHRYAEKLEYLCKQNGGNIAVPVTLSGDSREDRFVPDISKTKKDTDLY